MKAKPHKQKVTVQTLFDEMCDNIHLFNYSHHFWHF